MEFQLILKVLKDNESIGRLVSIIYRWGNIYFSNALDSEELGHGQLKMLMFVGRNEGATQQEISDYFQMDKGTTSFLIKHLVKNEYVIKTDHEIDKRCKQLYLTEKALVKFSELSKISKSWTEKLLTDFTDDERQEAFRLLDKMIFNIGIKKTNQTIG